MKRKAKKRQGGWFEACPYCGRAATAVGTCEIPANIQAYPIFRDLPIELIARLHCPSRHHWEVIAYENGIRDVVYRADDGRYIRLEQRTLPGRPGLN